MFACYVPGANILGGWYGYCSVLIFNIRISLMDLILEPFIFKHQRLINLFGLNELLLVEILILLHALQGRL